MKVQYVGQYEEVVVPMPGRGENCVERGGVLNTTNEHAASLLQQPANWAAYAPKTDKTSKADEAEDAPADAAEPTNSEEEK